MALLLNALRMLALAPPVFDAPAKERSPEESGEQPDARPELGEYRAPDLLKERRAYTDERPSVDCTLFVLVTEKSEWKFAGVNKGRVLREYRSSIYAREAYNLEEIVVQVGKPGAPKHLLSEDAEIVLTEPEVREKRPGALEASVREWAERFIVLVADGRLWAKDACDAYNLWALHHDRETAPDTAVFGSAVSPVLDELGVQRQKSDRMCYLGCELAGGRP